MTYLVDEGKMVDIVYLDFSKPVDIVSHRIPLEKLAAPKSVLKLFREVILQEFSLSTENIIPYLNYLEMS